jgi:hypothetical protein
MSSLRHSFPQCHLNPVSTHRLKYLTEYYPASASQRKDLRLNGLATLPSLPAELLRYIIEICGGTHMRKDTYKTMRAVCKDIDDKIVRHYGQEWCKEQHVILADGSLARFQAMSRRQLAFHI